MSRNRRPRLFPSLAVVVTLGCSAGGSSSPSLLVGSQGTGGGPGGGTSFGGDQTILLGDGGPSKPFSAHIESPPGIIVEFVTLSCSSQCADVLAVPTGGYAPYTFTWEDGSTGASRRVCPTVTSAFEVAVKDAGSSSIEFRQDPQTATARLTANVIQCPPDGGTRAPPLGTDAGRPLSVIVPGLADEYLATQPSGSALTDSSPGGGGSDVAPAGSPVEVPVLGGTTLTFAVTGTTSNAGAFCFANSPDGGCIVNVSTAMPATNGLSGLVAPLNSLIGVFLDAAPPAGTPPPGLDAAVTGTLPTLSPLLRQVFFIGDGLTGTGTGAIQRFVVPPGATRLFLASTDGIGSNYNNTGQFNVLITPVP